MDADAAAQLLSAAYTGVASERAESFGVWWGATEKVASAIVEKHNEDGFEGPPAAEDALYRAIRPDAPLEGGREHVQIARAMLTDYTQRFYEHWRYRQTHGGNTCVEWTGMTGMAKSSCMIGVAEWAKAFERPIEDYLCFDIAEVPAKLRNLKPGDSLMIDEQLRTGGEGSRTDLNMVLNIEDTTRQARVNQMWAAPESREHDTSQFVMRAMLWNPTAQRTRFLALHKGVALGFCDFPWASTTTYEAYLPWKKKNVERSMNAQFRPDLVAKQRAIQFFEDRDFVDYILAGRKPTLKGMKSALIMFDKVGLSTTQVGTISNWMYEICYAFEQLHPKFERLMGCKPPPGMREVARRCIEE